MYPDTGSRSYQLLQRGSRVIPGGNTRSAVFYPPYPIYMASGHGCRIVDVDGVERLDFVNCNSAAIHGHGHPYVVEAVARQARTLMASGMPTEGEVRLAELICERLPSVEQVRFNNSGTEALMFAVRAARSHTGRTLIVRCEGTYNGSYDDLFTSIRPLPDQWGPAGRPSTVPYSEGLPPAVVQDVVVIPFNDPAAAQRIFAEIGDRVACVVIDPFPSYLGFLRASDEFLSTLRELTHRHGALLIYDEVFSFRLDYHGAQGFFGVMPDLTALGKVIGGGLPVGAVGGPRHIMQLFDHSHGHARVEHSGTFSGNPMTMAAGIATLELLTPAACLQLNALGERVRKGLRRALADAGIAGQVRGEASMVVLLFHDIDYNEYRGFLSGYTPAILETAMSFHRFMLNHGVIFIAPGAFILSTAMTEHDIDQMLVAAAEGLREIARGQVSA